ncbi:phospholipid carrier-dependent glycosyltransferase [Candidatus Pacearchaeota archaeon]|nr:phospholipid carrier-dependent glycosyltransferase [Candidatus Pacearchaeota archaeon]
MVESNQKKISNSSKGIFDRTISFIFSNDERKWLILLLIIGFILRFIAANNIEPNADEMVHGPHAIGIVDSGGVGRIWQSITWSYLTDLSYSIFGINLWSARFLSVLFGTFCILLVFLLTKELFKGKAALIASALFTFSSFSIIYTRIEMDIPAIFFILLASYLFIKQIKRNNSLSMLAALFLGVAALIKTLSLFFLPVFVLYYLSLNKNYNSEKAWYSLIKFGIIIALLFSPIIIHNVLWYNNTGMVDAYLSQYFDIAKSREVYSGIQGINDGFKFQEVIPGILEASSFFKIDFLNFLLGILFLLFFTIKKNRFSGFFILFQAIPFFLITVTNRLPTHYAIFSPVFCIYLAAGLVYISDLISKKYSFKSGKIAIVLTCILILLSIMSFWPYIKDQTSVSSTREYVTNAIDTKDIVIVDARIYRGRAMWMFADTHYIEASYFGQLFDLNNKVDISQRYPTNLYFVECASDDCGWGTIASQPELNASMEELTSMFKDRSQEMISLPCGGQPELSSKNKCITVYKSQILFSPLLYEAIDSGHTFFFYPLRYTPRDQVIDYYKTSTFFGNIFYLLAKAIIWLSIILSIAAIFYTLYLIKKHNPREE